MSVAVRRANGGVVCQALDLTAVVVVRRDEADLADCGERSIPRAFVDVLGTLCEENEPMLTRQ